MTPGRYDAVVVGAGPNGLAAAVTIARAGRSVLLIEARPTPGGGTRTEELTEDGFLHDVCSAVHPLAAASPVFRAMGLENHGVEWVRPPVAMAHPLDGGRAAALAEDLDETAEALGPDAGRYMRIFSPLVEGGLAGIEDVLYTPALPAGALHYLRFGLRALLPARELARLFSADKARALVAGTGAHAVVKLTAPASAAVAALLIPLAHLVGWPIVRGGSQRIAGALVALLEQAGGQLLLGRPVRSLGDLPEARATLFDVTPRQLLDICGPALPSPYRRRLSRWRYGPGIFKVDWALSEPVPWTAEACRRTATIHAGGSMEEIVAAEDAAAEGKHPERPLVIAVQPTLFDPARAPDGGHTLWAYCHVPHGSTVDMTGAIEAQIERFAPGFKDVIRARRTFNAKDMEAYDANYIGGDISGGIQDLRQMFTRPVASLDPYSTPAQGIYICSSSSPPGGGVHGMCGFRAALSALRGSLA